MANLSQHERTPDGKEEWLTDPKILKALGPFDLDPCAPISRPWDMASRHYTIADNGLLQPWSGRVWLNPPYGTKTGVFMRLMAQHNNGIALVYSRTETKFFFSSIWPVATAIFFFEGRLVFYNADGTPCRDKKTGRIAGAGGPSCLVAYGEENARILKSSGLSGKFIPIPKE